MLAGSKLHDVAFGLGCRFPLPRHAPPHHIQWVSEIWTNVRRAKPPHFSEAEQLISWLSAGALLRLGSWELEILVFNGWDISAENLEALKRIRMEISDTEFNAAGVRAYLGQRLMMEGPQESKHLQKDGKGLLGMVMVRDEDEPGRRGIGIEIEERISSESSSERQPT